MTNHRLYQSSKHSYLSLVAPYLIECQTIGRPDEVLYLTAIIIQVAKALSTNKSKMMKLSKAKWRLKTIY